MKLRVECRGEQSGAVASTVDIVFKELVKRICARDARLEGVLEHVVVADDFPAALVALGEPPVPAGAIVPTVARALYRDSGPVLVMEGAQVAAAMGGDEADMARFVHVLHSEMWRVRIHLDGIEAGEEGLGAWRESAFDCHLRPAVEAVRNEYAVTRRTIWSLPADADLMLKHLMDIIDALPAATQEDVALALAEDDLDGLFVRSLGRIAHLLQTVAHAQGYLAGLARPLEAISPEMCTALQESFMGPFWGPLTEQLDALFTADSPDALETARQRLQATLVDVFVSLGVNVRRAEDGSVWVEAVPVGAVKPRRAG